MDDLIKDHAARVRAADPLVGGQAELSPVGDLLEAPGAVGRTTVDRLDPGTLQACWSPLIVHRLRARVAGPDPSRAFGALLDRWSACRRSDEPGQALSVSWPSRDTAAVRALAVRGFAPITAVAVRRVGPRRPAASSIAIRPAVPDDLEVLTGMRERLVTFDAQFGWLAVRENTAGLLRESLAQEELPYDWCWLAELDGRPAGCAIVQPPGRSGWISQVVNAAPVAYMGSMYVEPWARGLGVGAALAEMAHGRAAAEGASVMLLHHALPNPLSTPFWARCGYRPLITQWVRHLG
jgi:GNAT superfamily N-acetyltransferase